MGKPKKPETIEKLRLKKKESKQKLKEKRARLVVHNLPFTSTEQNLREHFEKFGDVEDVTLLKKSDDKLVGVAFIQFKTVQQAHKAQHYTNGKEFLGRTIICESALSKNKYEEIKIKKEEEIKKEVVEIKEEPPDTYEVDTSIMEGIEFYNEDIKIKSEEDAINDSENKPETQSVDLNQSVVMKDSSNEEEDNHLKDRSEDESKDVEVSEDDANDETDSESSVTDTKSSATDSESSASDGDDDVKEVEVVDTSIKKPHVISNDVTEGKTIFIKNVPFSATNDDLKQCLSQFGPLYYALICIDKFTEHSKGTAFVKFRNKEDADKCLQAGTELTLMGNVLDCHLALSKDDIQNKSKEKQKQKEQKDSRNLYLVKEGVILAGTKAAQGVSATDMAKRLQLEQYKTQMLRNLNMFVSRERLIIHNLPPSWNDAKLRMLMERHAGPNAVIREAKVMRDLRNVDSQGIGKSKEYGFVTFTKHEHALNALRSLNNNPNIFSVSKRPIVAFSIENRKMVKAKEKRLLNSRLNNPTCKDYKGTSGNKKKGIKRKLPESSEQNEVESYAGVTAKPGVNKMRSKFNLKTQARLHHEHLKQEKKKRKFSKKTVAEKTRDSVKQPKQKVKKKFTQKGGDNFSKLVKSYKEKLSGIDVTKKSKCLQDLHAVHSWAQCTRTILINSTSNRTY